MSSEDETEVVDVAESHDADAELSLLVQCLLDPRSRTHSGLEAFAERHFSLETPPERERFTRFIMAIRVCSCRQRTPRCC